MNLALLLQEPEVTAMQPIPLGQGGGPEQAEGSSLLKFDFYRNKMEDGKKRCVINPFCKSKPRKFAVCSKSVCCTAGN